ncbi:uncharacterized protein ATC70_013419 [Mucor velutinosus]|uniref:Ricin B lectin domain-containing protein n=1 Tax=Mucor velutinosus TaxID=708070 RepID=A0AAN7D733_9FUNG|nr:hypothetical protein ATC70_013419 [Mucor velutinosus]
MADVNWFYIKHVGTNKIIASCLCQDDAANDNTILLMRTQVIVTKPTYSDNELWCWDDRQLRNKSTGLVLDIRKGRIRFMEDTEICLYYKKSMEDSQNQLWAVQTEFQQTEHPLVKRRSSQKTRIGSVIYSVANSDWVLDVCPEGQKLILFPYSQDLNHQQRWLFIPEKEMILTEEPTSLSDNKMAGTSTYEAYYSTPLSSSSCNSNTSSSYSINSMGFAHGLTPAKRCSSQSSLAASSRKSS